MKNIIIIALLLTLSHAVIAGTASGNVERILVHSSGGNGQGVAMFIMENNANKPACSTAANGRAWAFSLENESGKAMYSLLLTAQAQQKSISVKGADNCAAWSDREKATYIFMVN
jgi:hypothetical protein